MLGNENSEHEVPEEEVDPKKFQQFAHCEERQEYIGVRFQFT